MDGHDGRTQQLFLIARQLEWSTGFHLSQNYFSSIQKSLTECKRIFGVFCWVLKLERFLGLEPGWVRDSRRLDKKCKFNYEELPLRSHCRKMSQPPSWTSVAFGCRRRSRRSFKRSCSSTSRKGTIGVASVVENETTPTIPNDHEFINE